MRERTNDGDCKVNVLYLTTRDVARPQTGADNRSKYLYEGLATAFAVDLVQFDRTNGTRTAAESVSVPYPPSELLAMVSVRFFLAVLRAVRGEEYDLVVSSSIGAVTYGLVASWLSGAAFVFDDHNVEADVARQASIPRFVVVAALEQLACARAALVVVPTPAVAATLAPRIRGEVTVVTNGFDAEMFTPDGESVEFDAKTLLFFGNFQYDPNVEAVEYIVDELGPRLKSASIAATVRLAGPGHEAIRAAYQLSDDIELLGFVEDLPATIRGADLVIVPLRTGSGSRLKIIESLACGTTVVSTPIGAEGWPPGWENLVLSEIETFANTAIAVLEDSTFDRSELDSYAQYSWQAQSRRFVDAVRTLVDHGEPT